MRTRLDMPKKSKKEKIIAEQKRKLHVHLPLASSAITSGAEQQAPTFQFQLTKKQPTYPPAQTYSDQAELIAIKRDLTKTLVLAFIAVSIELALYWFSRGKI